VGVSADTGDRRARRPADELAATYRANLARQPPWVRAIWATPAGRLVLGMAFLAVGGWILVSAVTDAGFFDDDRRAAVAFLAAPGLIVVFGSLVVDAVVDLVRHRNSIPLFHRIGWWIDERGLKLPVVGIYLVVVLAAFLIVR
jgi:hypothetical protein